ncbi:MAG: methyltransferase domain-containing protein, partial [Planctomycetes bacterium]|nr:methyltransferase domain-containing protein [Planctomycetota bacterium]
MTETFAHTKSALKQAFAARGIRPNKRLSQNFLIDPNLLRFVVKTAELTPNDVVLEIGSGPGNLTSLLADAAGAVCAVELDRKLYQFASEHLAQRLNVRLLHADILKSRTQIEPQVLETVSSLLAERPGGATKVVSNLPYSVSTPVIMALLGLSLPIRMFVLTVQKEIAERLTA